NSSRVCAVAECGMAFKSKAEVDEHRRAVHQVKVTVTHEGKIHRVYRDSDGKFRCPIGQCNYKNENSRYLLNHCNKYCRGIGPPVKRESRSVTGNGVVIPAGDEIQVHDILTKYNLTWNTRCSILICVQCSIGVPVAEVWSHFKKENQVCNFSKEDVKLDLFGYADLIKGNITPPDYEWGKACEPVQGLVCYNGYTCKLCSQTWPCHKTMENHFSKYH
ncbi:hypothetical protein DFH28DRAFT_847322, partial [Melampsora americana]